MSFRKIPAYHLCRCPLTFSQTSPRTTKSNCWDAARNSLGDRFFLFIRLDCLRVIQKQMREKSFAEAISTLKAAV